MKRADFYEDLKFCPSCRSYVRYLSSLLGDYCTQCDERVRLFSDEDRSTFLLDIRPLDIRPDGEIVLERG